MTTVQNQSKCQRQNLSLTPKLFKAKVVQKAKGRYRSVLICRNDLNYKNSTESSNKVEAKVSTRPPLPKHNRPKHKNRFEKEKSTNSETPDQSEEPEKKQHSVEKPLSKIQVKSEAPKCKKRFLMV